MSPLIAELPEASELTRAALKTSCLHCESPLKAGDCEFCCAGCETVFHALADAGLTQYYRLRDSAAEPANIGETDYSHFDDPDFLALYAQADGSLYSVELCLDGVHCAACVWVLEKLPTLLPGIESARVDFANARLNLRWQQAVTPLSSIAQRLHSFGYPAHPLTYANGQQRDTKQVRSHLVRIGVAGAAFGNVMLLSFALYSGEASGMTHSQAQFFRWLSMLLSVPSVLFTGQEFFRNAWTALKTRTPHIDVPITLGIVAALLWGIERTVRGAREIYFDSVTMLVFLLLVGRFVQLRQTRAARSATDMMLALAPSTSRIKGVDGIRVAPTEAVLAGSIVEVLAGQRIGVDGCVVAGSSSLDESLLTGEFGPKNVKIGDIVHAGTVNLSSAIDVLVQRAGRDTRLGQLVRQVERVALEKAPIVALADRVAGYFVYAALFLAAATYALWAGRDPEAGLHHAIALLIVTCPCALGMATPLAASVALSRAARRGIVVKGVRALEQIAKPGLFIFDKTGTLTSGAPSVSGIESLSLELRALLLAALADSPHPVATAVRAAAHGQTETSSHAQTLRATDCVEHQGLGVVARVAGKSVVVGSQRLLQKVLPVEVDDLLATSRKDVERQLSDGFAPLFVVVDGKLQATLGVGDPLREDAVECLSALHAMGYQLAILSGDRQELVSRIAQKLGLPLQAVLGEQSPEQKLAYVRLQLQHGPVYMVGDGVNDAGALALASVGLAVSGGAEASLAAADGFMNRRGLTPILELVRGARQTLSTIWLNIGLSLSYNLFATALCVSGLISPLIAAILMPISSLTVVTLSLRSRAFRTTA